jgi:hypothetical protein
MKQVEAKECFKHSIMNSTALCQRIISLEPSILLRLRNSGSKAVKEGR